MASSPLSPLWSVLSAVPLLQVLSALSMRDATLLAATNKQAISLLCPGENVSASTSTSGNSGATARAVLRTLRRAAIACVEGAGEVTTTEPVESAEAAEAAATATPQSSYRLAADQWCGWQRLFTGLTRNPLVPPPALTGALCRTVPLVLGSTVGVDHAAAMSSTWSASQLRCFLHAFTSLRDLNAQLDRDGARLDVWMEGHEYEKSHLEVAPDVRERCRVPLPFLLPWPVNGGAGDEARSQRQPPTSQRRSTSEPVDQWDAEEYDMASPENAAALASAEHPSAAAAATGLPLYYGAVDGVANLRDGDESSIAHLSSVSRGCPWPLASANITTDRTIREHRVLAYRIFTVLGVSTAIDAWAAAMECPGRRPIDAEEAEMLGAEYRTRWDECQYEDAAADNRNLYWSDWFRPPGEWPNYSDDRLPDATLLAVADLLRDSLVISFGSEHCQPPWPRLIVAPLAPGWIGGFICGASR